jgi:hypothetical protein
MRSYEELHHEAYDAYQSGQSRYASLKFQEAARRAKALNDEHNWFRSTVWAAEAEYFLGRYALAQALLLSAAREVGNSRGCDRYLFFKLRFLVPAQWRPRKQDLITAITHLAEEQRRLGHSLHDLHYCRLLFFRMQGDWQAALQWGEKSFHRDDDSSGVVKFEVAKMCAELSIRLQHYAIAEQWIEAIHVHSEWTSGWNEYILARQSECRLRLARARGDDIANIDKLLREFRNNNRKLDDFNSAGAQRDAEIRASLADRACGDPAKSWHPARRACRTRLTAPLNIHHRYAWYLHVLDYRLASLRYSLDLPAVDEEHVSPPAAALRVTAGADSRRRLQRARVALTRATRLAAQLDGMLQCGWRIAELARRQSWLRSMSEACDAAQERS